MYHHPTAVRGLSDPLGGLKPADFSLPPNWSGRSGVVRSARRIETRLSEGVCLDLRQVRGLSDPLGGLKLPANTTMQLNPASSSGVVRSARRIETKAIANDRLIDQVFGGCQFRSAD